MFILLLFRQDQLSSTASPISTYWAGVLSRSPECRSLIGQGLTRRGDFMRATLIKSQNTNLKIKPTISKGPGETTARDYLLWSRRGRWLANQCCDPTTRCRFSCAWWPMGRVMLSCITIVWWENIVVRITQNHAKQRDFLSLWCQWGHEVLLGATCDITNILLADYR